MVPQYIGILRVKEEEGRYEATNLPTYLPMARLHFKQNKVIRYIYLIINVKQGMKRGIG